MRWLRYYVTSAVRQYDIPELLLMRPISQSELFVTNNNIFFLFIPSAAVNLVILFRFRTLVINAMVGDVEECKSQNMGSSQLIFYHHRLRY